MTDHNYIFKDAKDQAEYERLRKIEELFDPRTRNYLERIGVREGMSLFEAGPGAGGLLGWMLKGVGDAGKVTAIDLETRFFDQIIHPNLKVIKGDLSQVELGEGKYDLIHERYVLMHNPGFQEILRKMTVALKPGGWILLEDADFSEVRLETQDHEMAKSFDDLREAIKRLFSKKGNDYFFGGKLHDVLSQLGFGNIQKEVYAPLENGGKGTAEVMRLSTLQLWNQYLQTGAVTEAGLQNYVNIASDPEQKAVFYSTVSVWGQKPFR
jgi:SAM-dependent methyltransferase